MSGSKTSEKGPVRAYSRGTSSEGAVRERAFREPPLCSSLESRALLVLLAIMLLGAVLRFYGLGFQSLWSDELASWDFSNRETLSQVIGGVRSDDHPPLYFLVLHFTQWIFGDSEWALRRRARRFRHRAAGGKDRPRSHLPQLPDERRSDSGGRAHDAPR